MKRHMSDKALYISQRESQKVKRAIGYYSQKFHERLTRPFLSSARTQPTKFVCTASSPANCDHVDLNESGRFFTDVSHVALVFSLQFL